jgi:2,4-dienoyl-CoA reductase-like NADH-dependent reductase (Old Yellow Enzyme family)
MQGRTADGRTLEREAYFLSFAEQIAQRSLLPIMTTGGIRRLSIADKVVESGIDLVGMASALALAPDLPNQWQKDSNVYHWFHGKIKRSVAWRLWLSLNEICAELGRRKIHLSVHLPFYPLFSIR